MNVLLVEPFFSGSHKRWSLELQEKSSHDIDILSLPGRHWKWRMEGGAIELASQFKQLQKSYQLILVSDMLDLSTFKALTNFEQKCALYFHENQLSYPWSPSDPDVKLKRDVHYAFINYKSALCADKLFFNSRYHMGSFLSALSKVLKALPDYGGSENIALLEKKSEVLPLGLDLQRYNSLGTGGESDVPLILWNHRWEYDKNPEDFFGVLFDLADENIPFELAILGENYEKSPSIFFEAKKRLASRIKEWGRVESFEEYARWVHRADILPVTNIQDFFGISVVEAIYCNCTPLLPKRLAYNEHINCDECFYETKSELKEKLRMLLKNYPNLKTYSSSVGKYDWQKIIPCYDDALLSLIEHE